jgi:undecaprenyl-diphosphatase
MLLAERLGKRERPLDSLKLHDGILIGAAQAIALIPGVSRSGITMSAGLFSGFEGDAAARFAFLLGTPAFLGAALLKFGDISGGTRRELLDLGVGFAVALIVGLAAINWLMRFIRTRSFLPFVYYRFALAAITLVIGALRSG